MPSAGRDFNLKNNLVRITDAAGRHSPPAFSRGNRHDTSPPSIFASSSGCCRSAGRIKDGIEE
jgi:hypothetical protein